MAKWWQLATKVFVATTVVLGLNLVLPLTQGSLVLAEDIGAPEGPAAPLDASAALVGGDVASFRFQTIADIINLVVKILTIGAAICFLGLVLVAGYKMVFSADKEKQLSSAKSNFMTGLAGLTVLAAAWWIVTVLSNFLGMAVPGVEP